jgi:hypothetical protein
MDLQTFFSENKEVVAVVIAGLFGILAALIKSKMKLSPPLLWFFASLVCAVVGAGLLFVEYNQPQLYFDPDAGLSLENKGSILALAGCLLLATGGIWGMINFLRLFIGGPVAYPDEPPKKKR